MKVKDFQKRKRIVKFLEKTFLNFGDFWLVDSDEVVDIGTRQQPIGIVFQNANKKSLPKKGQKSKFLIWRVYFVEKTSPLVFI